MKSCEIRDSTYKLGSSQVNSVHVLYGKCVNLVHVLTTAFFSIFFIVRKSAYLKRREFLFMKFAG